MATESFELIFDVICNFHYLVRLDDDDVNQELLTLKMSAFLAGNQKQEAVLSVFNALSLRQVEHLWGLSLCQILPKGQKDPIFWLKTGKIIFQNMDPYSEEDPEIATWRIFKEEYIAKRQKTEDALKTTKKKAAPPKQQQSTKSKKLKH